MSAAGTVIVTFLETVNHCERRRRPPRCPAWTKGARREIRGEEQIVKVSVLVDTYNHERFIAHAITSVLHQDMAMDEVEIVVVDDGSTDRTPEIVRGFEPRVRLLRKTNGGQASAFNAGVPQCHGEIVAFLDGDDWWAPGNLRRVLEEMGRYPEVGIVGNVRRGADFSGWAPALRIAAGGVAVSLGLSGSRQGFPRAKEFFWHKPHDDPRRPDSETAARHRGSSVRGGDEYLFTLAAASSTALILPEALTFYRIHDANLFQISGFNEDSVRKKQNVLACLARELGQRLLDLGVPAAAREIVTESVSVEADQLRLMVDGGYPWTTVRTEFAMYRILHEGASVAQWMFKCLSLLPALFLPPRLFYRIRRSVAANRFYLRARKSLLPIPQPAHTVRQWKTGV